MKTQIYHNPKCSKSRATLELLEQSVDGIDIVEYLKTPPAVDELDRICERLGVEPIQITRTKEQTFRDLGLSAKDNRPRREWLQILVDNPILIERPIVLHGGKAAIGRPLENVAAIL